MILTPHSLLIGFNTWLVGIEIEPSLRIAFKVPVGHLEELIQVHGGLLAVHSNGVVRIDYEGKEVWNHVSDLLAGAIVQYELVELYDYEGKKTTISIDTGAELGRC